MSTHAFLSPSASHRWLMCPPSAKLNATIPDQSSPYAKQGTDAHELCAYLVEKALGRDVKDPTENLDYYDEEMQGCAEGYAEFVMQELEIARQTCPDTEVLIEQKVDFSKWVEGGKGTADCILLSDGTAEIIDYKNGLGVMVSSESEEFGGNPQLMCYSLGVIDMFDGIYNIDTIRMAIYQPRRDNLSVYEMSKADLLKWADEVLAPTAALAMKGEGEFKAGSHCQFCKCKATCRKRAEFNLEMAQYDFAMPDTLEDHEVEAILMKVSIRAFDKRMVRYAYEIQKGICKKCNMHFDIDEMQADHITPWSKGGKTIKENCQMLCADCNRKKSNI